MNQEPMPATTLALIFTVWPFAAAVLLALVAVLCVGMWFAIPFLNRISALLKPETLSPRQFYE